MLVDDSIVRGTTSRKIVRMVRQAGAREVHLRISCPPTISPCFYGVDTPTKSELIACNHTVEEIRRFVEADSLGYLSLGSLRKAVADDQARILLRLLHGRLSDGADQHRRVDLRSPETALIRGPPAGRQSPHHRGACGIARARAGEVALAPAAYRR